MKVKELIEELQKQDPEAEYYLSEADRHVIIIKNTEVKRTASFLEIIGLLSLLALLTIILGNILTDYEKL